jgi:uridine kinase
LDTDTLVEQIEQIEHVARGAAARRLVVLVDGRSGSGKTVLAGQLAPRLGAQLVSLDDLYPGWDGLDAGSRAVHETVLRPERPGWQRWDWAAEREAEWHPLDRSRALVVEGCGALSRANRALATFAIWIELDAEERRRRSTQRDAGRFDLFWDRWAAQEEVFIAREHPRELADLVLDAD